MNDLYYNRQGEPIERDEWLRLLNDPGYRLVAHDVVRGTDVRTVWAGLPFDPHSNPPLIFETFASGSVAPFKRHYATEAEARAGHAALLAAIQDGNERAPFSVMPPGLRESRLLGFGLNYLNRAGERIDIEECERLFRDDAYRVVAQDSVGERLVSTVWLGLGQLPAFTAEHEPAVFETIVFGPDDDGNEPQWRYATEDEARAGHWAAVKYVQDMPRRSGGSREEPVVPDDDRPLAQPEDGSIDISGLDKAELFAALVNAQERNTSQIPLVLTHEQAAGIIQHRLGGGAERPFDFNYPIKCDIGGPRITAQDVALYDRDAGQGTMAQVVGELRVAYDRRRAERQPS